MARQSIGAYPKTLKNVMKFILNTIFFARYKSNGDKLRMSEDECSLVAGKDLRKGY